MATLEKEHNLTDSHWYTKDGKPCYSMTAKNGTERSTTLRDARKLDLLPSVTTIFNIMAKHGLEKWKITKAVEAALLTPQDPDEPEERWHERIIERSKQETSNAADLGTKVHDAIEAELNCKPNDLSAELEPYVKPALGIIYDQLNLRDIATEQVCVNILQGYAGRVDVSAKVGQNDFGIPINSPFILDFKTRKTTEGSKITPYDFQPTQIAAYAAATYGRLDGVYGANVYISTTEIGRTHLEIYTPDQLKGEYQAFLHMTALWRFLKKYDPRDGVAK